MQPEDKPEDGAEVSALLRRLFLASLRALVTKAETTPEALTASDHQAIARLLSDNGVDRRDLAAATTRRNTFRDLPDFGPMEDDSEVPSRG